MAETKRCAHPACNCVAPADGKYCSQYCNDAGSTADDICRDLIKMASTRSSKFWTGC
jgi:hypothetical protein